MTDLIHYSRRKSREIAVGDVPMGGSSPIRLQSMTDTATMDTEASVRQVLRIAEAGGEYVRLTTQGTREARNMELIHAGVREAGCQVPLIADVHFNPSVADVAALYCEKVRVNPGNYSDQQRLVPLLDICRQHHTALRIGVNHGSLSERIMSRYGDTPEGIVESCMEFLRICLRHSFTDVAVSVKASDTAVMVRSVRLLVTAMEREGMDFPLHLGVTEAGDGEDGRIKSAVGIGALLADGIGDTVRVSLSEPPEREIPVAREIVRHVLESRSSDVPSIFGSEMPSSFNWLSPERRHTTRVGDVGGGQPPVVLTEMPASGVMPLNPFTLNKAAADRLRSNPSTIVVSQPRGEDIVAEHRALAFALMHLGLQNPLLLQHTDTDPLRAASLLGAPLIDKLADGLIMPDERLALSILQASRERISKTEYIACPGCGRTLYDLQGTLARIKAATPHLKGKTIAVMGCIVNGPGEMAGADYGYVGAARGKISLYKGKTCLERNIPEEQAVERLLQLIEEDQA
ncbi:MAG: (E)-4-hydroxy-3-methylbut-2-enyl-diphosphate synthase [Prevotellaceae bacterium]|nr:(E)-4-hydroxy-3-methylbut-2-enyl-diphosphate synthase [Prevotellaceae bacterium]